MPCQARCAPRVWQVERGQHARGNREKYLLGSAALAALVIAGPAQAADLEAAAVYKAPPIIASSWTGFYAGLGLGFRTSRSDARVKSETGDLAFPNESSQPYDGTALRVSPYAGFNFQVAPRWVAGIEGDFGFAGQTTTRGGIPVPIILAEVDLSGADSLSVKTTWDTSLRGRLGYLLTPSTLAYATGGVAWQHYELTSTCACGSGALSLTPAVATNSTNKAGWTLGGGLETVLWGHWLARAEYRYADFGTTPFSLTHTEIGGPIAVTDNFDVKLRTHTATFGLAYKFGDPVAGENFGGALGAFASSAAAMSWSGAYAGIGLGARALRDDLTTTALSTGGTAANLSVLATSQPFDGAAFRTSPYAGFNWRFAPQWVAGLEGDFGIANRTTRLPGFVSPALRTFGVAGFGTGDALAVKTTWDASLRGRFGFLFTPSTMAYATGGVAWQHYDVTSTCATAQCQTVTTRFFPVAGGTLSNSATRTGWIIGGGIETALRDRWLARADYRYADFGASSVTLTRSSPEPGFNPIVETFDVKLRTHTVGFGLAYKFN